MGEFANIGLGAVLNVLGPPNFLGTLLGSIPNDPDRFQVNSTIFVEKFIFVHFVHYRNQEGDFAHFLADRGTHATPLHPGTGFI